MVLSQIRAQQKHPLVLTTANVVNTCAHILWGMCIYIGESEMGGNCNCKGSLSYAAGFGRKTKIYTQVHANALTKMYVQKRNKWVQLP